MPSPTIRVADAEVDGAACAAIYAPYVTGTAVSFEEVPPTAEELGDRVRAAHLWLVAESDGVVVGYAYGSRHRERAAYRWAADVAVYLRADYQRRGVGRALYVELAERLQAMGLRTLCAGVTLPNPASCGLHESLGFEPVGTYRRIGWKNGSWHDVRWYQLHLDPRDGEPPEPLGTPA